MRILLPLFVAALCFAQKDVTFEGRPAIEMANDKLVLTITKTGASLASLVLTEDPGRMSPLWDPTRMARESGQSRGGGGTGHFVCVDGFGPVSPEEKDAGLQGHGEAHRQPMEIVSAQKSGNTLTVSMRATLPIVQEVLTRTHHLVDGENVVYVESELENLMGFDRPVVWAEHATIGSPFLMPDVTVVDLSAGPSQTRPYPENQASRRRLASEVNFTWPMAPSRSGGLIDLRAAPANPNSIDHTTSLVDPNREIQFVTALNLEKQLLLGYLFRRDEFPWLQTWENYPPSLRMARGLEFSTQPYDVPRRESISLGRMFGAPTYRWLPAKSKITARWLMFYTRVPAGFRKVDDARLEAGEIIIEDRHAGITVELPTSRGL